jgi:serine/threonine protein kinase
MAERAPAPPEGADDTASEMSDSGHRAATGDDAAAAASLRASHVEIGTRLEGTYEVKKLLGQGAMGAVYLVEHVGLGKEFAAKVVSASRALDESAIARLRNEARITSAIEHENIVNVTHLGATPDGSLFIVMELLRGESLRERIERQRARAKSDGAPRWLPDDEVQPIVSAVLSAIAAAHGAGVVHRDLKPDNVFLSKTRSGQSRPKIVDFGIGKLSSPTGNDLRLTETGQTVGTPLYMAPEQFRASSVVGPAADQYALGVLIHEILTGELPFNATHVFEMVLLHATEQARDPRTLRPDLPASVAEFVLRCLEKDPAARFASADAALVAWRRAWSTAGTTDARPTASRAVARTPVSPTSSDAPRRAAMRAASVLVAVLALAGLALAADRALRERVPEVAIDAPTPHEEPPPTRAAPIEVPVEPPPAPEPLPIDAPPAITTRAHHVTSDPPRAEVFVDGQSVGHTPYDLSLGEGERVSIELRLGRRHVMRTIDATTPELVHVRLPSERAAPAEPEFPGLADR